MRSLTSIEVSSLDFNQFYCKQTVNIGMYEGRSINKLQNGAIPLILKTGKIRNIRFVGNLILKIHRNFLMMTSLL